MPQRKLHLHALIWAPVALALTLAGCAAPGAADPSTDASDTPPAVSDAPSTTDTDIDALLEIERMGVSVIADQWVNNQCSVELALSPVDIVCTTVLEGADLTTAYEDLGGGLDSLTGETGEAVRTAFEDARDAGTAWIDAGCADEFDESCADEGETLISTLLALDAAFDEWAA